MKKLILILVLAFVSCASTNPIELENRKSFETDQYTYKELPFKVEDNSKNIEKLLQHFKDYTEIKRNQDNLIKKLAIAEIEIDDMYVEIERLKTLIPDNSVTPRELKAFPTAEGFGKYATGGRGGTVIKVTNLNASGSGSFVEALLTSGPRIIVFEVGGTITLSGNVYVTNGDLTIAGQTAPGDGILLKGGMIELEASNIIIRYIRFRPGPTAPSGADALNITAWSGQHHENIIIDHCSLSWASDENFDIRALPNGSVKNVTIQNSIMAECGYGSLAAERTTNLTYYRNLYAHNSERNTRKGYPLPGTFDFELINNLIYGFRYATVPSMGAKFTVLNNKYKESSQTTILGGSVVEGTTAGQGQVSETYAYISGNILAQGTTQNNSAISPYLQSSPYASSGIQAIDASQLEASLLNDVGVSYPARDDVDVRLINQYINGNGSLATSGTYPTIQNDTTPVDTDNDGMSDSWEITTYGDLTKTANGDEDGDGYTNIEEYINQLYN